MLTNADRAIYREARPPPALAGIVACLWRRDPWLPPEHDLGVLPDGQMDVIWSAHGGVQVIGPQARALGRPCPPQDTVVGMRFLPGVGPPLLGVPAHHLADLHIPLAGIDARPAVALCRDLAAIEDPAQALTVLTRAVAMRIDSDPRVVFDPLVRRAAAMLRHPTARVDRVAKELDLSERQLERRFHDVVGYGPKTLHRILRFQRLFRSLGRTEQPTGGLAAIAATVGYADQAHLARECLVLSGQTPGGLARAFALITAHGASGIYKTGARTFAVPRKNGGPGD